MDRKTFIKNMTLGVSSGLIPNTQLNSRPVKNRAFGMDFSPDFDVFNFKGGLEEKLEWGYEMGFRAWECTWLLRKSRAEQNLIKDKIEKLGMRFGQFVGTTTPDPFKTITFAGRDEDIRKAVLENVKESIEVAKRMNTKFIHNVVGLADYHLPWDFQMANAIELLKRVAEIYEPHGITMIMETMNQRTQPGLLVFSIPQAYAICKAVNSPSLKINFDIFHVQMQEGNIINMIDYAWDQIGYFQIGDAPNRMEPGAGEINYKNILKHIYDKGYRGFLGLEHKISKLGKLGDQGAIRTYHKIDPTA